MDLKCNKKYDENGRDYAYPIVRARTPSKLGLSVGFEWEIPLDMPDPLPYGLASPYSLLTRKAWPLNRYNWEAQGYDCHADSGGMELGSPIFENLVTARSHARAVIKVVDEENQGYLKPRCQGQNSFPTQVHRNGWQRMETFKADTGIHVHVGALNLTEKEWQWLEIITWAMLNRKGMSAFIWKLSMRKSSFYANQAKATNWDATKQQRVPKSTRMVSLNRPAGSLTLEFRFFAGDARVLVPALDFSHSVVKFILTTKEKDVGNVMVDKHSRAPSIAATAVPKAEEYFLWLKKQKGYQALKSFLNERNINY